MRITEIFSLCYHMLKLGYELILDFQMKKDDDVSSVVNSPSKGRPTSSRTAVVSPS